jgi:molecular chaperone DnaK
MKGRAVGIDLGTSNSVVCVVIDGEAVVIPDREGRTIQPSVVSFLSDGRVMVGHDAKARMAVDPHNTVYSVKRLVGRGFYAPEIKLAAERAAYNIQAGADDFPRVVVRDRSFTVEEIQAMVLRHMKTIAEDYLGEPVTRAVITVPANFNDAQRRATKIAGQLAGLDVLRILNEPTAAALAYGYDQGKRERIAVYDLGGGTFDITILELRENVFEVLSTAGDTFLGGDDMDQAIVELILAGFRTHFGYTFEDDPDAKRRFKSTAEAIKIRLTDKNKVQVPVRHQVPGTVEPLDLPFTLTRDDFSAVCGPIVQHTFLVCDEALRLANLTSTEIDRLVLVGGSTRVPVVRQMVEQYFFRPPMIDINPDEVIAVGAAIYSYGIEQASKPGPKPPPLPAGASGPSGGKGKPEHRPRGDAPLLIDVTPHSLGIETVGGIMETIIRRNESVPVRFTRSFATSRDNQDTVRIHIFEGEDRRAENNRRLGEVVLSGIEPAPRGDVQIEVTFEIDTDGVLNVGARNRATGQVQQTRLNIAGGLGADIGEIRNRGDLPVAI